MTDRATSKSLCLPAQGYWVEYGPSTQEGSPSHFFCGESPEPSAQCPNCHLPLMRLLSLDVSDARLDLGDAPCRQVVLYFCWPCRLSQERFAYRLVAGGAIQLLQWSTGPPERDFPYPGYPRSFPSAAARLVSLSRGEQSAIRALNTPDGTSRHLRAAHRHPALAVPRHQVGGEPLLLQGWPRAACPLCGEAAPLLAAIADDCLDPRGVIGYAYAQVLFSVCRSCGVVLADNACD